MLRMLTPTQLGKGMWVRIARRLNEPGKPVEKDKLEVKAVCLPYVFVAKNGDIKRTIQLDTREVALRQTNV